MSFEVCQIEAERSDRTSHAEFISASLSLAIHPDPEINSR